MRKTLIIWLGAMLLSLSMAVGCRQSDAASSLASHSDLFNSGQLKDDWNAATTAMQTNGYVEAETVLNKMRTQNPNTEQLAAINNTIKSINNQLFTAAEKGDANARNALKKLANIEHYQTR